MIQAIRAAAPDGYVRVFVDGGDVVQQLLQQCASLGTPEDAAVIHQLLTHFPPTTTKFRDLNQEHTHTHGQRFSSGLVEPLTAREQEVLELIAAGCTNREIASRLVTTENTIKKHTSHIFEK